MRQSTARTSAGDSTDSTRRVVTSGKRKEKFVIALAALVVVALIVLWRYTPLAQMLHPQALLRHLRFFAANSPLGLLTISLIVAVGNTLLVPINVLLLGVALAFPGWKGFLCGLVGSIMAAVIQAHLGRRWGAGYAKRRFGEKFEILSSEVGRSGFTSVVAASLLPVAPNIATNIMAGVCRVPMWKLVAGTIVGFLPGLIILNLLGRQMREFLHEPGYSAAIGVVGLIVFVVLSQIIVKRYRARIHRRLERGFVRSTNDGRLPHEGNLANLSAPITEVPCSTEGSDARA